MGSNHKVLGRLPLGSIKSVSDLGNVFAVIVDGVLDDVAAFSAKNANARYLVGKDSRVTKHFRGLTIITEKDLQ